MIVVADTGPLNYLLWIDAIELLPQIYGSVIIPEAVRQELSHPAGPERMREWAASLPKWIIIQNPVVRLPISVDLGEREAISLAVEIDADLILLDDRRGREAAEAQHLIVTGTLGVLGEAAKLKLIDLKDALDRLRQTNFRISEELMASLLARFTSE